MSHIVNNFLTLSMNAPLHINVRFPLLLDGKERKKEKRKFCSITSKEICWCAKDERRWEASWTTTTQHVHDVANNLNSPLLQSSTQRF